MERTNGDSVRMGRATLALIIAVIGPALAVGAAGYQLRQTEASAADHELRLRRLELSVAQMARNEDAIRDQSVQLKELRAEIRELTRQLDRDTDPRTRRRD